jgi:hypothetical protein
VRTITPGMINNDGNAITAINNGEIVVNEKPKKLNSIKINTINGILSAIRPTNFSLVIIFLTLKYFL